MMGQQAGLQAAVLRISCRRLGSGRSSAEEDRRHP